MNNDLRRIVITGLGFISPIGSSKAEVLKSLQNGQSGLQPLHWTLPHGEVHTLAGQVAIPQTLPIDPKLAQRIDRVSLLSLIAADAAWRDAGSPTLKSKRKGVFWGVGFGGMQTVSEQFTRMLERGPTRVSPFTVPAAIGNAAAGHIAEYLDIQGPCLTYTNACAASSNAIGEAFLRLRSGLLDVAICGGAEAGNIAFLAAAFQNARALAPMDVGCLPFAVDRQGFILGEGSAAVILQPLDQALQQRKTIYAEIIGYGTAADAYHITEPHPQGRGALTAMRQALDLAKLHSEQIDYINAHATGTKVGDAVEANALIELFGKHNSQWSVSSTKGLTGHLLGGAGALEAAITALVVQTGLLPANLPRRACEFALPLVTELGQQKPVQYALSNSFGFGGVNATLAFAAPELHVTSA